MDFQENEANVWEHFQAPSKSRNSVKIQKVLRKNLWIQQSEQENLPSYHLTLSTSKSIKNEKLGKPLSPCLDTGALKNTTSGTA